MRPLRISMPVLLFAIVWVSSCTSYSVVPKDLRWQVDHGVRFADLHAMPDEFRGRMVVFGGEVLSAKRLKEGTRIEVLQLPLDNRQAPVQDRTASEGRFFAFEKEFLDPAKLPPGTRITITGEVTGAMTSRSTRPTTRSRHWRSNTSPYGPIWTVAMRGPIMDTEGRMGRMATGDGDGGGHGGPIHTPPTGGETNDGY